MISCEQAYYSSSSATVNENVVVTPATVSLRAKKVFHLSIRKYTRKQNCMKVCSFILCGRQKVKQPIFLSFFVAFKCFYASFVLTRFIRR